MSKDKTKTAQKVNRHEIPLPKGLQKLPVLTGKDYDKAIAELQHDPRVASLKPENINENIKNGVHALANK